MTGYTHQEPKLTGDLLHYQWRSMALSVPMYKKTFAPGNVFDR